MAENKIKILHVAQAAGGVDRYIRMLLKYLDKNKFENILVCSQDLLYQKGRDKLLTSDVIAAEGDNIVFYDTKAIAPGLKLRKFDTAEIEKDIEIYAKDNDSLVYQHENLFVFRLAQPVRFLLNKSYIFSDGLFEQSGFLLS